MSVHDGDTISVQLDRGMDDQSVRSIRLKDVFAPELYADGGLECRLFVMDWLTEHSDGSTWPFMLETFRTPRSDVDVTTLSRFVGMIQSHDGRWLNGDVQDFITKKGYSGGTGSR